MIATATPSKNGTAHERNGHAAPPSRITGLAAPLDAVPDGKSAAESNPTAQPIPPAEPEPTAEKTQLAGRTEKGTFAAGNKFARGNPNARKMAALRTALLEGVTADKMKALGQKLYDAALAGDLAAAKLLLAYAIGKPPDAVEPDRLDLEEWAILAGSPTPPQVALALLDGCHPGIAAEFFQKVQPGNLDELQAKMSEAWRAAGELFARRLEAEREARIGK